MKQTYATQKCAICLYQTAKAKRIKGRSDMNRQQVISALRSS